MSLQSDLDYSNQAHLRVCAETRVLEKKTTLKTTVGVQEYALATDVLTLLAVSNGVTLVPRLSDDEALRLLCDPLLSITADIPFHYVINERLGFIPTPSSAITYTLYYVARPASLTSGAAFEVTGDYERLVEELALAMALEDDGQPELAEARLGFYDVERVRLEHRRRFEHRNVIPTLGYESAS